MILLGEGRILYEKGRWERVWLMELEILVFSPSRRTMSTVDLYVLNTTKTRFAIVIAARATEIFLVVEFSRLNIVRGDGH